MKILCYIYSHVYNLFSLSQRFYYLYLLIDLYSMSLFIFVVTLWILVFFFGFIILLKPNRKVILQMHCFYHTFPCVIWWKDVHNTEKGIAWDNCKRWIHLKCKEVKDLDHKYLQKRVIIDFVFVSLRNLTILY